MPDWVEFPMTDSITRQPVACRASFGALRKIGGIITSTNEELFRVFGRERERFEEKAKAKFEAGQDPPHIFPEDL
jgi:hypothetical protein